MPDELPTAPRSGAGAGSTRTWLVTLLCLLVLYPLSAGPVEVLTHREVLPRAPYGFYSALYYPLDLALRYAPPAIVDANDAYVLWCYRVLGGEGE